MPKKKERYDYIPSAIAKAGIYTKTEQKAVRLAANIYRYRIIYAILIGFSYKKEAQMNDKKEEVKSVNLWEHQREEEVKCKNEEGGGEVNVIEEDGADISEMWLRMQAKGMIGATVIHSAGTRIDETRALAMMKNAMKHPKYMELSETQRQLKKLNEQIEQLESFKEERSKFNGNKEIK